MEEIYVLCSYGLQQQVKRISYGIVCTRNRLKWVSTPVIVTTQHMVNKARLLGNNALEVKEMTNDHPVQILSLYPSAM